MLKEESIINFTCKECPDRNPTCHDVCKKYLNYKKELRKAKIKELVERMY